MVSRSMAGKYQIWYIPVLGDTGKYRYLPEGILSRFLTEGVYFGLVVSRQNLTIFPAKI